MDERSGIERRRHRRVKTQFSAVCNMQTPPGFRTPIEKNEIIARISDLSESGMAILTDYDIPSQSKISSRFTLINLGAKDVDRYKLIETEGEVCYNFAEDNLYRLGVCFTRISETDKTTIADFTSGQVA